MPVSHLCLLLPILFLFFLFKKTCLPYVSCLKRPEEGVTSSAADLTSSCEASGLSAGTELKSSGREHIFFITELSLQLLSFLS